MAAIAYIRKSKVNSTHHLSWDVQESEVRALAARHGDTDLQILSDWGRSGRGDRTRLRAGYKNLKQLIESDRVSVLYSYSLSRLARSLIEYAALAELCRDHGVCIRLCKEGEFDYASASGRFVVNTLANVAQMEAELAQERAKDTVSLRRSRGDHIGRPPYGFRLLEGRLVGEPAEPVRPVLDAYREAGNYHGAAWLLNRIGPNPRTGKPWSDMSVRRVVMRSEGVEHRPTPRGRPAHTPALLARLLRCPCGTMLTPSRDRKLLRRTGEVEYVSYICWRARHDPRHARRSKVTEGSLLPWAVKEAARLTLTVDALETTRADARRQGLLERRQRVIDNYEDGLITREQRTEKVEVLDAEVDRLIAVASAVISIPQAIDWDWAAEDVNAALRAMWEYVELDEQLQPVRAKWTVPEWRAP